MQGKLSDCCVHFNKIAKLVFDFSVYFLIDSSFKNYFKAGN